mmetsp:Transcript_1652/g.3541  ORF Transcript_1652/g.3541 Transcript_1652/m.3541 type:complete len:330 (-) Transcript_1652:67-1056(-)
MMNLVLAACLMLFSALSAASAGGPAPSRPPPLSFRVDPSVDSFDDMGSTYGTRGPTSFRGREREYDLWGTDECARSGSSAPPPPAGDGFHDGAKEGGDDPFGSYPAAGGRPRRGRSGPPGGVPPGGAAAATAPQYADSTGVASSLRGWFDGNRDKFPGLKVRTDPQTTLKLRKRFRPLKTVLTLGADFNTQLGVWQFKSSWEDSLIGGRLTLNGRELQMSKTWLLSVGAVEDLVTRLRLRAAVDMATGKAYARFGFRTERLSPINVVEGFTLKKMFPLDGSKGHASLEVKANFAFPEPEIEYSTDNKKSLVGMGDIEVAVEELNLVLDY